MREDITGQVLSVDLFGLALNARELVFCVSADVTCSGGS